MIEQLDGVKETVRYQKESRVRLYYNVEMEGYPVHWHAATEVIMPLRGDYHVKCQNEPIHLRPGDILVIPPGVLHEIAAPAERGQRLIILFNPMVMNHNFGLGSLSPFLTPCYLVTAEKDGYTHTDLQAILTSILRSFYVDEHFKYVTIYADLMKFMSVLGGQIIARAQFASAQAANRLYNEDEDDRKMTLQAHVSTIYESCEFLRSHSREEISLDALADRAGFSKFYFSRLFKEFTHVSFVEYLNRCRILDAENLLSDPDSSVTDVALTVGFNSISTFNRVFRKYKNCTPSEFKKLSFATDYAGHLQSQ